jgi:hypothetical protein
MQFIDPFAPDKRMRGEQAGEDAEAIPESAEKPAGVSSAAHRRDREHEVRRLINDLAELAARRKPPAS